MHLRKASAAVAGVLLLVSCSADEPLQTPLSAPSASVAASPSTEASPSPSPSASPSPSPAPLSPFEDDPVVQGLRGFYAGAAQALNANDFQLPALVSFSTPARAERNAAAFAVDGPVFVPGPVPFAPIDVRADSPTNATVRACVLTSGWYLVGPGGAPRSAEEVLANTYSMVLAGDVWQVDRISDAPGVNCAGVPIIRQAGS